MAKKKSKIKKWIIIGVVILVLILIYIFITNSAKEAMKLLSQSYIVENEVKLSNINVSINQNGVISPYRKYEIYPTYTGEVTSVNYEIGENVGKNSTLYKIGGYNIKSPMKGTLITSNIEKGDYISTINQTNPIAVVADISKMITILEIDELDINKIEIGMDVEISSDAIENETFNGKVTKISQEGKNVNGVTTYEVTVQIEEPRNLKVGMNIDATIVVQNKENILTIPMDAINKDGNKTYVYVKDETVTQEQKNVQMSIVAPSSMEEVVGYKKKEVQIGINNKDYVEIISGLEKGDKVYSISSSKTLTEYMLEQSNKGMTVSM